MMQGDVEREIQDNLNIGERKGADEELKLVNPQKPDLKRNLYRVKKKDDKSESESPKRLTTMYCYI